MKKSSLFALLALISSTSHANDICMQIGTYPEGGHVNYTTQIISSRGYELSPGDELQLVVQPTFESGPTSSTSITYVGSKGQLLILRDAQGENEITIGRSQSFSTAPFQYNAQIRIHVGSYKFSSDATPSSSDPKQMFKLPYQAQMLNSDYPADQQGTGILAPCVFR